MLSATTLDHSVCLRLAGPEDAAALNRLAALDSAPVPRGSVLLAEMGGEAVAAVAVHEGRAIADPFRPTAHLIDALRGLTSRLREGSVSTAGGFA